ncbi:MAG: redoxin domain-containing protein [Planctomycetota bacterium]
MFSKANWWWLAVAVVAIGVGCTSIAQTATEASAGEDSEATDLLTIGSAAPTLDIEHWVQTGDGRFEPVTSFDEGQVYVVEFWATWCPPCIASMPHLSSLQQKYADQGVTIVSVSDEPLDTVTNFLEREAEGQTNEAGEPLTFDEITSVYCLTSDPDGSTNLDYMQAAKRDGIPCAFLVGKDGRIEWIGHPMSVDDPLEQVVAGTWDREAFATQFKAAQEFQASMERIQLLLRAGKFDQARATLDELISSAPTADLATRAAQAKLNIEFSIYQRLLSTDQTAALDQMKNLVAMVDNNPQAINSITWLVVRQANTGEANPELIEAAISTIEPIMESGDADASLVDTLAHLVHLQGDLDRAIELSQAASAEATGRLKASIDKFLEELQAEKSGTANEAEIES